MFHLKLHINKFVVNQKSYFYNFYSVNCNMLIKGFDHWRVCLCPCVFQDGSNHRQFGQSYRRPSDPGSLVQHQWCVWIQRQSAHHVSRIRADLQVRLDNVDTKTHSQPWQRLFYTTFAQTFALIFSSSHRFELTDLTNFPPELVRTGACREPIVLTWAQRTSDYSLVTAVLQQPDLADL